MRTDLRRRMEMLSGVIQSGRKYIRDIEIPEEGTGVGSPSVFNEKNLGV